MAKYETGIAYVAVIVGTSADKDMDHILEKAGLAGQRRPKDLGAHQGVKAVEVDLPELTETSYKRLVRELATLTTDTALLPIKTRKKRLLISDMDSTIIAEECLDELADFAGLKAEISAITERAMAGELNFEEALTTRVGMLKGLGLEKIEACYRERITVNAGAKTLVATMKTAGAHCLLVSGGFTAFTSRVAAAVGFHAHYGNTLHDDGTTLTGKVGMPILGREAKQERLETAAKELGLQAEDALAIGDGANDLAMIKAAGLGIAYRAKPIVATQARAAITHTDLTTALFFQGYHADEFVTE